MMILCWVVVSLHILIGNTVDGDCSIAYDEYYKGIRKCCDGKFKYYTCFDWKYSIKGKLLLFLKIYNLAEYLFTIISVPMWGKN